MARDINVLTDASLITCIVQRGEADAIVLKRSVSNPHASGLIRALMSGK